MLRVHGPAIKRGITIDTVTPTQLRAVVATRVTPSPTVRVTDANGSPVAEVEVFFKVTAGGGTALPLSGVGTSSARTDLTGRATADWTLGTKAIADTLSVGVGTLAPVVFTALATPGPFAQLVPDEGEGQIAAPGSTLPHALRAKATDTFGNPIAGVPVTFSVISGEGTIDGQQRSATRPASPLPANGLWGRLWAGSMCGRSPAR